MAGWSQDQETKLKKLYFQGYSCSMIAMRLGCGFTRNAVIGKVHRLGLPRRGNDSVGQRRVQGAVRPKRKKHTFSANRPHTPKSTKRIEPSQKELDELQDIQSRQVNDVARVTFAELQDHHCKFPIGESPNVGYCGQDPVPGLPYCRHHALRCYQPPRASNPAPSKSSERKFAFLEKKTILEDA